MAFSSGAALAATLLIRKMQQNPIDQHLKPIFKCAIFFCGGIPAVFQKDEYRLVDPNEDGILLRIPTAHIWGSQDKEYPDYGPVLYNSCQEDLRERFIHHGGHVIPGSKDRIGVQNAVRLIKNVMQKALAAH